MLQKANGQIIGIWNLFGGGKGKVGFSLGYQVGSSSTSCVPTSFKEQIYPCYSREGKVKSISDTYLTYLGT